MSAKKQNDLTILVVLGLVTFLVIGLLVFANRSQPRSLDGVSRTSYSTNVNATLVFYTLLDEFNIPINRLESLMDADALKQADVIFMLDPFVPLNRFEEDALYTWVSKGGILVTTETDHIDAVRLSVDHKDCLKLVSRPQQSAKGETLVSFTPLQFQHLPLARDVNETSFARTSVFDTNTLSPVVDLGIAQLLFQDHFGIRAVCLRSGRGKVIFLSDCSFLANDWIGKVDNSILAINLLDFATNNPREGSIVFDEYHLGNGTYKSGFGILLNRLFTTSAGWCILVLIAAGILWMIYQGRQFGPRYSLESKKRRSKAEFIDSVASTYRAAKAHRLTLKLLYNQFRKELTAAAGLSNLVSNAQLSQSLAYLTHSTSEEFLVILNKCQELLSQRRISEHQLQQAISQLAWIERKVLDEHRRSKSSHI